MSILVKNVLRKMRLFCAILLIFCSRQTGVESERYLKQPTLIEALPLSSSRIYLEWKGPINHPGGIRYRIYVKKESETFRQHNDISGASSKAILDGLEPNVKYEVCVAVVDNHYKTASSSCDDVAVVTTPAQLGHVSKTDRKYLSKAGFYRGSRHYWPLDEETQLRDVKYSRDGKQKGSEVSIASKGRGYLSVSGNGWVRLGKFPKNCVCDTRHCAKNGLSVALWVKLSNYDNETKILFGSDTRTPTNSSGLVIFQTLQERNGTQSRYISTLVFMRHSKWKCAFPAQPGVWFYLTITWSNHSGLRMFKNSILMDEQKRPKRKVRVFQQRDDKCSMTLSPPTALKTTLNADYDDLVIWYYELNQTLMHQVFRNSIDLPKIVDCKTNGTSLDVFIEDKYQIYDIERDFKITWWRSGGDQKETSFTKDLSFSIHYLVQDSEYIVEIQRRMFVSESSKHISKVVLSKSSKSTCNTKLYVPTKPKKFRVREKAEKYFLLEWQPPDNTYGSIGGYKISYRVDDFKIPPKWTHTFRSNEYSAHLESLEPFTDYIIKLSCRNQYGNSKAMTIRATTAEGIPTAPRRFRVKLKGEAIVAKWREPEKPNGLVQYRLFALVNGTRKTICSDCGEMYKLEDVEQYTNYTFWVIAYNINDLHYESGPSEYVHITTPSYTPSSPRNLTTSFTESGINVRWERSSQPMGRIEYKLLGYANTSKRVFCDECGLHYIMKNVERYTVYTFWAVAYNVHQGYESGASEKVRIDTASYVPAIPGELRVDVISEGILISWNKSSVQHGSIRYQLTGLENGVKREFCSDCGLDYLINKSEPNMNYSFWVVAHNNRNGYVSLASSIVQFHTARRKPPPPEHILVPEVKDSSAKVTWDPPGGLSEKEDIFGYKVTLYDAYHVIDVMSTQSHNHEFKNLNQFSKYYVTVQVLSRAGYGPPSSLLTIHTKDADECSMSDVPCSKHAQCINSAGSYFCSCISGYVGDGTFCEALPAGVKDTDFCPEETARNVTWKQTYHGHQDKRLCPNGTIGISTRECSKGNDSRSYWSNPNLSNCVSAWISEVDDKLADRTLSATAVGDFFLNLLDKNDMRGLYGGDIIKSVNVIDSLYNKSKSNELNEETSNPEVARTLLKNLINITEKIISPEKLKIWGDLPEKRRTEHSLKIMDGLENAVLKSARIVNFSSIPNEHINVQYGRVSSFKLRNNVSSPDRNANDAINSVKLPQQEKDVEDQAVAVIKYNTIAEVLSAKNHELDDEDIVNSAVLSISLNPPLPTPFQKPLEFKLSNKKDGKFEKHKCAFFNTSRYHGFWSTNGCEVFNVTDNFTVCHCYHMTSFSILMQVKPSELSYSDKLILGWITRVGLYISLVALGLAFVTFVFLPRPCGSKSGSRCFRLCEQGNRPTYLKKIRTNIHANLILSLALGEALFLWGIEKTHDKTTCYTVAVALHYLFLVAFHWMAAEGVILYLVLVKVFQRKSAKKDKRMFMIICWGTPAAIVCIALVVGHQYYLHEKFCWLSVTHGMIWGFVGPALAIIMVNFFFLCCTFYVMGRRQSWAKADKNMVTKIRYWAKGAAIVTCLLGVTWVFGVFFLNSNSVAVAYIFTICNVFQGLFIFVFHCLLDEKIRQQYYHVLCSVQTNTESRSPGHSTSTTGKKERRRSTFNSWFWSAIPTKFHDSKSFQDSKSESCPTVAENTLKRMNSSTHSLSLCVDKRLLEIKRDSDTMRPRGMSSIYHDSDENMDNIPDNILTVKHGSKNNSGRLDYQDEDTTGGVFEGSWISTLLRENSREFQEVPQETCEDCLYEMKDWEEQQEILKKTNSLHEGELKTLNRPCSSLQSEQEYLNEEENMDELCEDNIRHKEDQHELLPRQSDENIEQTDQCTSYTSIVPQMFLSVPGSTSV